MALECGKICLLNWSALAVTNGDVYIRLHAEVVMRFDVVITPCGISNNTKKLL